MAPEGWNWILVAGWASAAFLLFAVFEMGAGYYSFLRWFVFGTSIFFLAFGFKFNRNPQKFLGIAAGILWNPLAPIYLDRGTWFWLDLTFALAFFFLSDVRVPEKEIGAEDRPENWS